MALSHLTGGWDVGLGMQPQWPLAKATPAMFPSEQELRWEESPEGKIYEEEASQKCINPALVWEWLLETFLCPFVGLPAVDIRIQDNFYLQKDTAAASCQFIGLYPGWGWGKGREGNHLPRVRPLT